MTEQVCTERKEKPSVKFIEDTDVIVYVEDFKSGDLLYSSALREVVMFLRNDVYLEKDENALVRITSVEEGKPIFEATSGSFIKEKDIATSNLYYLDRNIHDFIDVERLQKRVDKAMEKGTDVDLEEPLAGRLYCSNNFGVCSNIFGADVAVVYTTPTESVNAMYVNPTGGELEDSGIFYKKMESAEESVGYYQTYSAGYLYKGNKFDWDGLVEAGRTAFEMLALKDIESMGLYNTLDMYYQDGFMEGYQTGMATGITEGVKVGKSEGYGEGYEEGYEYAVDVLNL